MVPGVQFSMDIIVIQEESWNWIFRSILLEITHRKSPWGKVIDFRCTINIDDFRVDSGDLIVADIDGVCTVQQSIEREVISRAFKKATGEKNVIKAIERGMTAHEAWNTYGIL